MSPHLPTPTRKQVSFFGYHLGLRHTPTSPPAPDPAAPAPSTSVSYIKSSRFKIRCSRGTVNSKFCFEIVLTSMVLFVSYQGILSTYYRSNNAYKYRYFHLRLCTLLTHKTQTCVCSSTRTDRVDDDGVGVLGAGGRGDHASSTSASRAATQLDFLGGQLRYGRLRCSGTRDLASVPPPKPSRTSKMASSRPKLCACRA